MYDVLCVNGTDIILNSERRGMSICTPRIPSHWTVNNAATNIHCTTVGLAASSFPCQLLQVYVILIVIKFEPSELTSSEWLLNAHGTT